MRVRKDVDLPDNAIADIRQVSLLGEKYVALEPPAGGRLVGPARRRRQHPARPRPAATPRSRRCSARCRSCSAAAAWPSSAPSPQELNKVMSGREEDLRHLLGSLEDVVGTLDDQKADIIRAMRVDQQPDRDAQRARSRPITGALDVAGPAIKVLADQHDELIAMLVRARPARRGRHPGDPGQQGRPAQDAGPPRAGAVQAAARPATSSRPGLNLLRQLPVPQGGLRDRPRRLRQHLDPRRHQPRELPAARRATSRTSRLPDIPLPDLPTRRRGAQRRRRSACRAATSPARPARRCWPTSTC